MFMNSTSGSVLQLRLGGNLIKLFTAVIYEFSQSARVFVLGKPFQPSLMLVSIIL